MIQSVRTEEMPHGYLQCTVHETFVVVANQISIHVIQCRVTPQKSEGLTTTQRRKTEISRTCDKAQGRRTELFLNLFFNIPSYYLSNNKSEKQIIACISYLNDLYCSPNIIWVMKSRKIKWAGHVARVGERRSVFRVLVEKPEGKTQT